MQTSVTSDFIIVSDRPRPLLVILNLTEQVTWQLHSLVYSCTYQSLIDDLLEHIYRLNKVTVNVSGKNDTAVKKKTYDLNTKIDLFFAQYAGMVLLSLKHVANNIK